MPVRGAGGAAVAVQVAGGAAPWGGWPLRGGGGAAAPKNLARPPCTSPRRRYTYCSPAMLGRGESDQPWNIVD